MQSLLIILATADQDRHRTALTLALSAEALGRSCSLFYDAAAVPLLSKDITSQHSDGQATIEDLFLMLAETDIALRACQTGLVMHNISAEHCRASIQWCGMVHALSVAGDAQIILA